MCILGFKISTRETLFMSKRREKQIEIWKIVENQPLFLKTSVSFLQIIVSSATEFDLCQK